MSEIQNLNTRIRDFAIRRNWEQFHTPKNLAMAIAGEAGELAAEFQWLTPEQSSNLDTLKREAVTMEIADIAIYLLRIADVLEVDIQAAVIKKIKINEERFPEVK